MGMKQFFFLFFVGKKSKWPTWKRSFSRSILNIFQWKFYWLILWLVELIDAKGIGVAQPKQRLLNRSLWHKWLRDCPTLAQKQGKNAFFVFLDHFWAYVGQPHGHIGWARPVPFASINSTNPRTNPWIFHEKILRIDRLAKWGLFESAILNFFFNNFFFFLLNPMKISQSFLDSKDGSKFWWLPCK
jgi:hypothetical protein